ncbi:hypothetical protein PUN28_007619 [Cardiocondyla obscurior]|uniref:Uncharacterized protein n=1 Tax=Cardiocondyla obscurior TaxID=286306 RepID=A0AAW2G492_9HYME
MDKRVTRSREIGNSHIRLLRPDRYNRELFGIVISLSSAPLSRLRVMPSSIPNDRICQFAKGNHLINRGAYFYSITAQLFSLLTIAVLLPRPFLGRATVSLEEIPLKSDMRGERERQRRRRKRISRFIRDFLNEFTRAIFRYGDKSVRATISAAAYSRGNDCTVHLDPPTNNGQFRRCRVHEQCTAP